MEVMPPTAISNPDNAIVDWLMKRKDNTLPFSQFATNQAI
ncbi:hypothetical protein SynMITS9220_00304 [Synechococcus sp. MIT S9220]|nr:hypothetical protein SynMITS9220_00304 [Synechococcus sp. MIT S9220]